MYFSTVTWWNLPIMYWLQKSELCHEKDSYLTPKIDNCIDKIGNANFGSKFYLLKGYLQVALSEKQKQRNICICDYFITEWCLQYQIMFSCMKNAPVTFQRRIHIFLHEFQGYMYGAYIKSITLQIRGWLGSPQSKQKSCHS